MKRLSILSSRRTPPRRVALAIAALSAAFVLSAGFASSASAFQWWVGNGANPPRELLPGEKLAINEAGSVHQPFTLRWLSHRFEVQCKAVKYKQMFLEGPIFLGAESIVWEECSAKKPKNAKVVGGKIETRAVFGEIKPNGSKVEFDFAPTVGTTLATFTMQGTIKHKHRHHVHECTFSVEAQGALSGTLGDATTISTEKTYEFHSTGVTLKSTRTCNTVPAARRAGEEGTAGPTPKEEREAAIKKKQAEVAECKAGLKSGTRTPTECKKLATELKELEGASGEAEEVEEEAVEEEREGKEEEAGGTVEKTKGKSGYSATEGWGVE